MTTGALPKGDERQVRKKIVTVAVLASAIAPATLAASAGAATTTPVKPIYCIPPASALATAQGAVTNTLAAIGKDTPSALAGAGGVTITTGASAKGQLVVSLYEPMSILGFRLPPLLLGYGASTVPAAGCSDQLRVSLNLVSELLLRLSKTVNLEVIATFVPSTGAKGSASGKVTLSGGGGLLSLFTFLL